MPKDVMFYYLNEDNIELTCCFSCAVKLALKGEYIQARTVPKDWIQACDYEDHDE